MESRLAQDGLENVNSERLSVFGRFTRSASELWWNQCGLVGVIEKENDMRRLFSGMGIHLSKAQVHEMLQIARECSGRDPSDLQLSYGEFCLFSKELKKCYQNQSPKTTTILPKVLNENNLKNGHLEKNMSKSTPQCQVFLGGSCNPTTWRQDVAIPMLRNQGITYYNPQVAQWEEALLEAENRAKKSAAVLFFVFDPSTRNVASMIEAGYMAGCNRKLVVVVDSYSGPGQIITGEPISQSEYMELSGGLLMVQDLLERQGIPVFSQLNQALNCTAKIVRENIWPQDLNIEDKDLPIKYSQKQLRDKLMKLHDAFLSMNSNKITLIEANSMFKIVTNRELTQEEIKAIVANKKNIRVQDVSSSELSLQDLHLSFQEFCCIVAEFENQPLETRRIWDLLTQSLISPIQKIVDWAIPRTSRLVNGQATKDVFLGGSCETHLPWRETIAVPLLRKHGLTHHSPSMHPEAGEEVKLSSSEVLSLEASRVFLFVISNKTRDIAQMTLAAHFIGLGCKVVLCIQLLAQGTSIIGEELSAAALKDYNRGRSYLTDISSKDNIPVFSDVEEAVECVVEVVQKNRTR